MRRRVILSLLLFSALSCSAATRYVSPSGSATSPYDTWEKAATTILAAYTGSADGDTIILTNGTYARPGNAAIQTNLTWQSVNGPDVTIIHADGGDYALYPTKGTFNGLTICGVTGGWGGVVSYGTVAFSNCIFRDNKVSGNGPGGGLHVNSGSATVRNSKFIRCQSTSGGGGAVGVDAGCTLELYDCEFRNCDANTVHGGAIYNAGTLKMNRCTATSNRANIGSAIYGNNTSASSISNSFFGWNVASGYGCMWTYSGVPAVVANSIFAGNQDTYYVVATKEVYNCTVVGNNVADGSYADNAGVYSYYGANNIIRWNRTNDVSFGAMSNTCYRQKQGSPVLVNCITNEPQFVDTLACEANTPAVLGTNFAFGASGIDGLKLQSTSPCVDKGTNLTWMATAYDYSGTNARIQNVIVDMGAFEYVAGEAPASDSRVWRLKSPGVIGIRGGLIKW